MTRTRRVALQGLALLALAATAGCAGLGVPRSYHISTEQLEQALRSRTPMRHSLAGIVNLRAQLGEVRPLPQENRLATQVRFDASGPLLPQAWHGSFDLLFGLRFEPSDHSLRAQDLELQALRLPMVMGRSAELLEGALTALAQQMGKDLVLYRLNPRDVERLLSLGLRPEPIQVTPRGLRVEFSKAEGA